MERSPGQWNAGQYVVTAPDGGDADVVCECPQGAAFGSRKYWEANARLIAAAPDMLAVLNAARIVLKNRDQTPQEMKLLDAIKAAVGKAEGR